MLPITTRLLLLLRKERRRSAGAAKSANANGSYVNYGSAGKTVDTACNEETGSKTDPGSAKTTSAFGCLQKISPHIPGAWFSADFRAIQQQQQPPPQFVRSDSRRVTNWEVYARRKSLIVLKKKKLVCYGFSFSASFIGPISVAESLRTLSLWLIST